MFRIRGKRILTSRIGFPLLIGLSAGCRPTRAIQEPVPNQAAGRAPMPFAVLYLARHGRTDCNARGQINGQGVPDHLDRLGYLQRAALFWLLKDVPFSAIFASTLARSRETALPIARHLGLQLTIRPELDEFRGGIFEGLCKDALRPKPRGCSPEAHSPLVARTLSYLRREVARWKRRPLTYRAPGGGESVQDVLARLRRFLATVPPKLWNATVLIVGHGGTNRFLLGLLLGLPPSRMRTFRQGHLQVLRLTRRPKAPPLVETWLAGRWRPCRIRREGSPAISCPVRPNGGDSTEAPRRRSPGTGARPPGQVSAHGPPPRRPR